MEHFVNTRIAGRPWAWVLCLTLGLGLLLRTSNVHSGLVATLRVTRELPALTCRIPAETIAPQIKALSRDIARRFHLAESAAMGITHAAFTAGRVRGIDPMVLLAVAAVESKFKSGAVNPVTGATGLMQVMPRWHQDKIVNVGGDPSMRLIAPNIDVGAAILADYLEAEDGDLEGALDRYLGTGGGVSYAKKVHYEIRHLTKIAAST